ncbi:hypothetical protein GHT06_022720 [Daphnia sinensis]|uniref:Transmembrane protein n=1 Tax=Daphnia sinensis TaxID=1820382 RepID=A0AAD5KXM4_9CRUS|nr:hypothetical protein GHT06_022720 [Daphnia sinensis]
MRHTCLFVFGLLITFPLLAESGLISYGLCQSGCNAVAVACYAAAGFTFGASTFGAGIPAAIVACNTALGTCMAVCAALFKPIDMKICILLAIAACATAFVLPSSDDLQSLIIDAQKAIQESDLPEGMKQELSNLLNDPAFVEELVANNVESFAASVRTATAEPAERCLFIIALLIAQLVQSMTTTVATTVATTIAG